MLVTTKLAALSSIEMFDNFCHDLLAKIVEHINGISGTEGGCNTDWTLVSIQFHPLNTRLLYASRNSDDLGFKLSCEIIEDKFKCDFI